jgi:antitoxin component YwqK of YwqJK toxin-antitoxin module
MKRLLTASLMAAAMSAAHAQTANFDIVKSATVAAKEAKITCKKLAVAPQSCVIAYFDEDFEVSKKPSEFYRVLNGKTADGQFVATDYYSSGQQSSDTFATRNRHALLTSEDTQALELNAQNYIAYHENGAKYDTTNYVNGLAEGAYQSWHENGAKESEGTYKNGIQTGEWTTWHENGKLESKGSYDYGKTDEWHFWYENGAKETVGTYKDGNQTGEWTAWYDNGKLESKGSYNDDGEKTGEWHFWHENGAKETEGAYKNSNQTGEWTTWYDNGKLESKGPIENNLQTGQWTFWHENGEKESQGAFDDEEQRHGTWTEWDDTGKVIRTSVYANGELISVDGVPVSAGAATVDAAKAAMRK